MSFLYLLAKFLLNVRANDIKALNVLFRIKAHYEGLD